MSRRPIDIVGFEGVDATKDPFLLAKESPQKSSMSLNYRSRNKIKTGRYGYAPVLDMTTPEGYLKKSGVFFPYDALAILPFTQDNYHGSFYLASSSETGATYQTDFTIEFWYKASHQIYERTVMGIPCDFTTTSAEPKNKHLWVTFDPRTDEAGTNVTKTYLTLTLMLENSSTKALSMTEWISQNPIPMDGEWHHCSIVRNNADTSPDYYIDSTTKTGVMVAAGASNYGFPTDHSWKTQHTGPLMYNYMRFGGGEIALCDIRIWEEAMVDSDEELTVDYTEELEGNEDDLVLNVKFFEGDGKTFTDSVSGVQGYFAPSNPWVNEDSELVFTGYQCLAHPSVKTKWYYPDWIEGKTGIVKETQEENMSEEGAYDGGILWDDRLLLGTTFDYEVNGVWAGVAQLRIRFRQLKEGVICGRLGMCYAPDHGRYRLFLADPYNSSVYLSDPVIDASYIGTEKTITVKYHGDITESDQDICRFFLDDWEITDSSQTATEKVWSDGTDILDTDYVPVADVPSQTDDTAGALGGSLIQDEMCVAFDLIFFRQWWDIYPVNDTFEEFIEATYDQEFLTEDYRVWIDGIDGYFKTGSQNVYIEADEDLFNIYWRQSTEFGQAYIKIPLHYRSDEWDMGLTKSAGGIAKLRNRGSMLFIYNDSSDVRAFKQDILIRRILDWDSSVNQLKILQDPLEYGMSAVFDEDAALGSNRKKYFNGALISNLVNEFNSNTFKNSVIDSLTSATSEVSVVKYEPKNHLQYWQHLVESLGVEQEETFTDTTRILNMKYHRTILDDSPLSSIKSIGTRYIPSRFLILGGLDRTQTRYRQRSLEPRWCSAPMELVPITLPAVRGIYRYRSEDEKINRLLVVAHSGVFEIESDGTLVLQEYGWLDRNDDEPVNFTVANNKLVIMDSKSGIKINYKGHWSRLGIERPVDIEITDFSDGGDSWDPIESGAQYAYVAQYVDTENNVVSGTIPVFGNWGQGLYIADYSRHVNIQVRDCKEPNVDRIRLYRTLDIYLWDDDGELKDPLPNGTERDLFLVHDTFNSRHLQNIMKFRDVWDDVRLATNDYLPEKHYGQDLVPLACKAMTVAYNRMFYFNSEYASNGLYFSDVDFFGFPNPDQIPADQIMIVEAGNTSGGTALIEFSSQLFAFKDDAIFRISELAPGSFGSELIYKGVGCVNQRCCLVGNNALFFMDRNGIYAYQAGEPVLVSSELARFFEEEVNRDQIDKSFMLHSKDDDVILTFVPSADSSYCDRCIVFDVREKNFTIDHIPDVTCGFVDINGDIYLGSPYGQVWKYTRNTYLDGVSEAITGTGTVT